MYFMWDLTYFLLQMLIVYKGFLSSLNYESYDFLKSFFIEIF
jgi:hypothetical protein